MQTKRRMFHMRWPRILWGVYTRESASVDCTLFADYQRNDSTSSLTCWMYRLWCIRKYVSTIPCAVYWSEYGLIKCIEVASLPHARSHKIHLAHFHCCSQFNNTSFNYRKQFVSLQRIEIFKCFTQARALPSTVTHVRPTATKVSPPAMQGTCK